MNFSELIAHVATERGITKSEARRVISTIFAAIAESALAGRRITIRDFGTFSIGTRAARAGRNPQTGEKIAIPAERGCAFYQRRR